jgi:hypothetical protein
MTIRRKGSDAGAKGIDRRREETDFGAKDSSGVDAAVEDKGVSTEVRKNTSLLGVMVGLDGGVAEEMRRVMR